MDLISTDDLSEAICQACFSVGTAMVVVIHFLGF
jgi:hypothetical protein